MQVILTMAYLSLALFMFTACTASDEDGGPAFPDISVDAAAERIANDKDVVVLDIRTPAEYEAGHIPGAVLVDCKSANFSEELKKLDPSKTYVMH
jgi:hypothetical protein